MEITTIKQELKDNKSTAKDGAIALNNGLPADRYALVLPTLSSSSSITISINDRESEKKFHSNKSSEPEGSVVKMGPCGGPGGDARDMHMEGVGRIIRVVVHHGGAVDAMSVLYERDGREEWTELWGGGGGKRSEIRLHADEHLTGVVGHCGMFNGWFVVRSLTFVGNKRTFGPYGKEEGAPFALPAAGGRIIGFHARSYSLLDAIGIYVKMD